MRLNGAAFHPAHLAALWWLMSGCAAAAAGDEPRDWLSRTNQALTTRNYQGVFVHEHAGQTETLRVIHRVSGDMISERLLSMDGSGREFIRKGTELICYLPDQRVVLVEKSPASGLLLGGLPQADEESDQYVVRELARTRVSGRDARVITVTPRDELRYGYRLWIDEATAMPLKSQLRSPGGEVIDQIVFASLTLPARIPEALLEPAVDARGYRWIRRDHDLVAGRNAAVSWQATALPAGFRMTVSAVQVLPGAPGPVEHLVFSDGMASVSVFVEARPEAPVPGAAREEDAASLGSSSVYSTTVEGYRITAIGEVPPSTVRAIARSIRAATPAVGEAGTADSVGLTTSTSTSTSTTTTASGGGPATLIGNGTLMGEDSFVEPVSAAVRADSLRGNSLGAGAGASGFRAEFGAPAPGFANLGPGGRSH